MSMETCATYIATHHSSPIMTIFRDEVEVENEDEAVHTKMLAGVERELESLNEERERQGLFKITPKCAGSFVKFDYGKNREGYWKATHMSQYLGKRRTCPFKPL